MAVNFYSEQLWFTNVLNKENKLKIFSSVRNKSGNFGERPLSSIKTILESARSIFTNTLNPLLKELLLLKIC